MSEEINKVEALGDLMIDLAQRPTPYAKLITHDETDYLILIETEDCGEFEGWTGGSVLPAEVLEEVLEAEVIDE